MNTIKVHWRALLLGGLGILSLILFVIWRQRAAAHPLPAHEQAGVVDTSRSAGEHCDCLNTVTLRVLRQSSTTKGATFSVMRTGDEASALEPVLVAEYTLPATRQVIERNQTIEAARARLLQDLRERCQQFKATNRSPIFKAVTRGVAHLRAKGCGPGSDCVLYVASDLEELTEKRIRQAMKSATPLERTALPAPLDNAGIRIVFLGVAQTIGTGATTSHQPQQFTPARSPEQIRRVEEVWRRLFTQPALVSFEPFCGAPTTPSVPTH